MVQKAIKIMVQNPYKSVQKAIILHTLGVLGKPFLLCPPRDEGRQAAVAVAAVALCLCLGISL